MLQRYSSAAWLSDKPTAGINTLFSPGQLRQLLIPAALPGANFSQEVWCDGLREVEFQNLAFVALAVLHLPNLAAAAATAATNKNCRECSTPAERQLAEQQQQNIQALLQPADPTHQTMHASPLATAQLHHMTHDADYTCYCNNVTCYVATCVHSRMPSALTRSVKLAVLPPTPK